MTISKLRLRGIWAVTASVVIAALIKSGIAQPYPNEMFAYLTCIGVGVWGLIDFIRGA
ncbi:hypothetical protein KFE94_17030 [bacterium SCSIO 12643]|nr:hypothetical protein KFE94_17030 [bacterium SCSIO 12643]